MMSILSNPKTTLLFIFQEQSFGLDGHGQIDSINGILHLLLCHVDPILKIIELIHDVLIPLFLPGCLPIQVEVILTHLFLDLGQNAPVVFGGRVHVLDVDGVDCVGSEECHRLYIYGYKKVSRKALTISAVDPEAITPPHVKEAPDYSVLISLQLLRHPEVGPYVGRFAPHRINFDGDVICKHVDRFVLFKIYH